MTDQPLHFSSITLIIPCDEMNETYNPIELECHNPLTLKQQPPANENRPPAADKTPQVCHTTWEVYIKEKPKVSDP